jgi:hypothetical protein
MMPRAQTVSERNRGAATVREREGSDPACSLTSRLCWRAYYDNWGIPGSRVVVSKGAGNVDKF